jgi:putative transposase
MDLSDEMIEQLKADLKNARTYSDLMGESGAIKKIIKSALEGMLDAELSEHLGYPKYSPVGKRTGNNRNGTSQKTIRNDLGEIELNVPRDRNASFDPVIVKKYQRTVGPIEDKIISMYAKGMTTRDIQSHVREFYGLDISASLVSQITDKIMDLARQWHNRPLDQIYPIVFFDAIHYNVHTDGRVIKRAAYSCLGIDINGKKDLLGIWVGQAEGAAFWLNILTELQNRGVKDIIIACVDGLKGFSEAIETVFPMADIQLCIIHLIRNTLKYISHKDRKAFMKDLRQVYKAPTLEAALIALDELETKWGIKYPLAIKIWRNNWERASTYFKYPEQIRNMIYTTNSVEALHRQFRKVTKQKSIFPHDDALKKMLYLAFNDLSQKWNSVKYWNQTLSYLSIIFEARLKNVL